MKSKNSGANIPNITRKVKYFPDSKIMDPGWGYPAASVRKMPDAPASSIGTLVKKRITDFNGLIEGFFFVVLTPFSCFKFKSLIKH